MWNESASAAQAHTGTFYSNLCFILMLYPSILWKTLQLPTGQRNPVFQRSFWKNHHQGIDLLRQRTNSSMAAWQLNSTTFAGMVCGTVHSLHVPGQRCKPLTLNTVQMWMPHNSPPSAVNSWETREGRTSELSWNTAAPVYTTPTAPLLLQLPHHMRSMNAML